jgi:hypothetical protein
VARTRRLDDLRADVRLRADNTALTNAVVDEFINQSISDLYDMLTLAFGADYFETETPLVTVANVATVALPVGFFKLTALFWVNGSYKQPIHMAPQMEAEDFITGSGWSPLVEIHYRLQIGNLKFFPTPLGVYSLTLKYIPSSVRLAADSDTFDGYNGWEEWVILDAAQKCLEREGNDGDAALLMPRKQRMEARIDAMADRNQSEPARIQDVYATPPWPWGFR